MAQILVGATIVGSIETVWSGTVTPPREGVIKRWTRPAGDSEGSVALLKGREMGRFKLGSTVINLFAPGKVKLVEQLKSLRHPTRPAAGNCRRDHVRDRRWRQPTERRDARRRLIPDKKGYAVRLIYIFPLARASVWGVRSDSPDAKQIAQELEQAKAAKPAQPGTVEALQSALNALEERSASLERARQYQQVIDNFPKLFQTLRSQIGNLPDEPRRSQPTSPRMR